MVHFVNGLLKKRGVWLHLEILKMRYVFTLKKKNKGNLKDKCILINV